MYFMLWRYNDRDGGFSATWTTIGQVHQQIDELLNSERKVVKIEIHIENHGLLNDKELHR